MAKNKRFEMRLTEDEYAILEARASEQNFSISEMIRYECIENPNGIGDRVLCTKAVVTAVDTINQAYFACMELLPIEYQTAVVPIKKGVEDLWQSLR